MDWAPDSWWRFEARQQPDYPDPIAHEAACAELAQRPALVDLAAIDSLTAALARAQAGEAFLLQGGDCAERLDAPAAEGAAMAALLAELSDDFAAATGLPVILVGRLAGQFAKPRSRPHEVRGSEELPAWRGDSVNGMAFDAAARIADPDRLIRAYDHSAATLAVIQAPPGLYVSHEALLLPFEEALVRTDARSGRHFAGSGHFLWIGARTLSPGSAHVELLRGLANPIGLKCGPDMAPGRLLTLLDRLNPQRLPGRITLICRPGRERIDAALPPLLRAVAAAAHPVLWCCDPLHGNTRLGSDGRKRRDLAAIAEETSSFFRLVAAEGQRPAGLHLEMTADPITECNDGLMQGACDPDECRDPRLNPDQARRIVRLAGGVLTGGIAAEAPALV